MYDEPFDEGPWDASVRKLGPREAAQALLRAQLEADGQRRQTATAAFHARLRIAKYAGIPIVDLQRRSGAARQSVYDAIKRPIDEPLDDLAVLALIATGEATSLDSLSNATEAPRERIRAALSRLHSADYVKVLAARDNSAGFFTLTGKGLEQLHIEVDSERLRSTHSDCWTVFIAIEKNRQPEILAASKDLLGDDLSYGVVDANVAPTRMRGPEFAIIVRAPDTREALVIVEGLWAQMRQRVGGLPFSPHVVALSPPRD